jgi:hypothetical protein
MVLLEQFQSRQVNLQLLEQLFLFLPERVLLVVT